MKVAIMQPYFFPYIGYFQLINAVDSFVIYDNIEYTKKGWINRNRFLLNGEDAFFTLPLRKGSDYLAVNERFLADNWTEERVKILRKLQAAYAKAPRFQEVNPLLERVFNYEDTNLFGFIYHSVQLVCEYLSIDTKIIVSSQVAADHSLKGEQKVIAICKALDATAYINPTGGVELYSRETFEAAGIRLQFLKTNSFRYTQFKNNFVPFLSIIDVIMFNDRDEVTRMINNEFTVN